MGAWDELDTEISVEVDTSELENLQLIDDPYGIFEPVTNISDNIAKAIDTGSKKGVKDLANRNRSFQEQFIRDNCDNPSGMLASSINDEQQDDYTYIIGTRINHIYPMSVEYGRREVYPIRAKALAFYLNGELVFRKKVAEAKPRPFVAPAYEKTNNIIEPIMIEYIGIELNNVL